MNRHPLDPISLIFGGLLAAVGGFLVSSDARWESASGAWVLPVILVLMGAAILWSTLARLAEGTSPAEDQESETEESEEYAVPGIPDL